MRAVMYGRTHARCSVLSESRDCSLPGSPVHRAIPARTLEWVAISYYGDLSDPGIEPKSPVSPTLAGKVLTAAPPGGQAQVHS